MFIRSKTSKNSPRKSVQIVENKRNSDSGKVSQKVVCSVGIAYDEEHEQKLYAMGRDMIAQIAAERRAQSPQMSLPGIKESATSKPKLGRPKVKKIEDILPPSQVSLDDIEEEKRIIEGVDEVAGAVYKQLGFADLLKKKKDQQILKDVILTRMVERHSKHKLQRVLERKYNKHIKLDSIYRMMDKLHEQIPAIKHNVFKATQKLVPEQVNLMFFDVTTLYFESEETSEDDIRQFGYSKDHRFNTTQVVLALATNADGLPVGYELFPGNKAEVKTLLAAIESWSKTLPIGDVCFIGDRAMFSEANLRELDHRGYSYVIAAKLRSLPERLKKEVLLEENYQIQSFASEIGWVGEFEHQGRRLISSYKTKRAINDAKKRQQVIEKINKTLSSGKQTGKLITNNGVKKYTSTSGNSKTVLDEAKIALDAQWDGMHGVITNIKNDSAKEVLSYYSRLWVIEDAFRINKHNLKIRPIYHWKKERIESHIALCYMSFACLKHLQYRVGLMHKISVDDLIEELLEVQASIHVHKRTKDRYRLPSSLSHKASKIYRSLGLKRELHATIYQP